MNYETVTGIRVTVKVNPKQISSSSVKGIANKTYTGSALTQKVTVADRSKALTPGKDYTVSYVNNKNIGTASVVISGKGNYQGSVKKTFQILVKKGSIYTVKDYKYEITNASINGKGTVSVAGTVKKNLKKVTVGSTVTIGGKKFKITKVGKYAFKNHKKITAAVIGDNVAVVEFQSFFGCTSLTSVTIGKGLARLGGSAFWGDSKLKAIRIKSDRLKKVGDNALMRIHPKAVVKVPKAKLKNYQKLLKGKGQKNTVQIRKY